MGIEPGSLMDRLSGVHDPRRREGQRYKFQGLIGMLVLAALHGETSLRGMWMWGCARWEQIAGPLDLWGSKGPPVYVTVHNLLATIDAEELGEALNLGGCKEEKAYSIDGKRLRGSKRATVPALQVITAAGHQYREVLRQAEIADGDEVEAAIALLHKIPLKGKIVSLDAGILQRTVAEAIVEKGGGLSRSSERQSWRTACPGGRMAGGAWGQQPCRGRCAGEQRSRTHRTP